MPYTGACAVHLLLNDDEPPRVPLSILLCHPKTIQKRLAYDPLFNVLYCPVSLDRRR